MAFLESKKFEVVEEASISVFCIHKKLEVSVSEYLFQEIQSLFYEPRRNLS